MPTRIFGDYHPAITNASKSVLLELMTILKSYRDSLVLIDRGLRLKLKPSRKFKKWEKQRYLYECFIDRDLEI